MIQDRIDASERSALAICGKCGARELRDDRSAAKRWLAGHETNVHPEREAARRRANRDTPGTLNAG